MEAVVSASQGAVQILLGKLGNVLATKYVLLGGVRGEIQELKDELESMTACLRDLADSDDHNEQTRTWMKQVREVAFDVEDCMDRFCHHLSKHHGDRQGLLEYLNRMFNMVRTLSVRHKVATDIQGLKSRAQKVSDRKQRYTYTLHEAGRSRKGLDSPYSHPDNLERWLPAIRGDGSGLVGMGNMTDAVVELLNNEQRQAAAGHRVLSIVGFGGLGKTTLATTVYNTPKLGGIQCRAFVPVSQTYDVRSLLESMLKQLSASAEKDKNDDPLKNIKDWNKRQLSDNIKKQLDGKRYLIVLDDVWRAAAWDQLNVAIPRDNNKGSIIITTRSHEVAKNCCTSPNDPVYEMKRLQEGDSEKLFFKTVFESGKCPADLLNVSKDILARCNGLPLAIVSIGRMLARRQNQTSEDEAGPSQRLPPST
ncbi:disease resistance protein Pik-2 [Aegilops tauschii subsp. strangulata]|uniref:Disease resistance protein RPP13 n=6 Tax=Triticinae TaxID=1648030 RepID=A0A452ZU42_AEGTS|nr:disease resistance protein Pik-2 [Aegilops tauschii subsp. strangulata]